MSSLDKLGVFNFKCARNYMLKSDSAVKDVDEKPYVHLKTALTDVFNNLDTFFRILA